MKEGKLALLKRCLVLRCILFVLIGSILFWNIQNILAPNWNDADDCERRIHGIDYLRDTDLDVIFLGASHVYRGVSPMELYEKYGILSYNLATPAQPVAGSWVLLKKMYEEYNPETVVLDVSSLFYQPGSSMWRYILDNMEFSLLKYQFAKEYAQELFPDETNDGLLSIMFPIIRYHSLWTTIKRDNFRPTGGEYYTHGQLLSNECSPSPYSIEDIIYETEQLEKYDSGKILEFTGNKTMGTVISKSVYDTSVNERALVYLQKIKMLCEEHGSRLLLIKIPTMKIPQWYPTTWTQIKSAEMSVIAEELDLPFLDLMFGGESIVSFETDTMDTGTHLNMFGAKKISDYLGAHLLENHYAKRKNSPTYEKSLEKYKKVYSVMELQSVDDFHEYIDRLKERKENCTIISAGADDYVSGMTETDYDLLRELGLDLIERGEFRDSYVGVISGGEVLYEAVSDYEITYQAQIPGAEIEISSKNGWMTDPRSSIKVNQHEYAISHIGLDIVIYDHETQKVIDSVLFNTFDPMKYCIRNWDLELLLSNAYISELCYDGW